MTHRDHRSGARWAEATRKAQALDDIACEVARYVALDSDITSADLTSRIIGIIETKTNFVFIKCFKADEREQAFSFRMSATERDDSPNERVLPDNDPPSRRMA